MDNWGNSSIISKQKKLYMRFRGNNVVRLKLLYKDCARYEQKCYRRAKDCVITNSYINSNIKQTT